MAFFDKLSDIAKNIGDVTVDVAKNIGDKTSDVIETTKIKNRMATEKRALEDDLKKIGQYYYEKYLSEGTCEEDVRAYMESVQTHAAAIEAGKAEIEALKEDIPSK